MAKKKSGGIQSAINGLPKWLKIIFALPVLDGIVYGLIYRMCGNIGKKKWGLAIVGFFWWWLGMVVLWLVDLITIIVKGKPIVLI